MIYYFFFSSRRRHTRLQGDWSSDVCSSDLRIYRHESTLRRARRRLGREEAGRRLLHDRPDLPAAVLAVARYLEIGRASCRERVEMVEDREGVTYSGF